MSRRSEPGARPGAAATRPRPADAHPGKRASPALRDRARVLLRAAGFSIVLLVPAVALAYLVRAEAESVLAIDRAGLAAGTEVARSSPAFTRALLIWQEAFQARWVNLAAGVACLYVWRRHGLASRALWAAVTIVVAWNLGLAVKFLVQRARPLAEEALTRAPGYSFPSGHTTNVTATGLVVVFLLWPVLGRAGRVALCSGVGAAVLLTGLDRVLLGAHYPSDVVAGVLIGTAMAGGSYLGYRSWSGPGRLSRA